MSLLLTIDQGNSHPHVGVFRNQKLDSLVSLDKLLDKLETKVFDQPFNAIYCGVGNSSDSTITKLKQTAKNWVDIDSLKTPLKFLDMPVHYSETLGSDRLTQAYYLYKNKFGNKENCSQEKIMLIDAGTFTTVDFISNQGFEGGYIYPGVKLYFSLYTQGKRLPVPRLDDLKASSELPHNTQDAITQSFITFNQHTLNYFRSFYNCAQMILTGGQAHFFSDTILQNYPVQIQSELIHHALNFTYFELNRS